MLLGLGDVLRIVSVAFRRPCAALSSERPLPLSLSLTTTVLPAGMEKVAVPMVCVLVCFFLPFLVVILAVSVSLPLHVAVLAQVSLTAASAALNGDG